MTAVSRNQLWARVLIDELVRAGVRLVVVAPGSRSTPLVLEVAARREIRTVVQIDERSAGYFALGVGRGAGHPAAVITTSGTAVANLLPAVVEAYQGEVPLILLTADRPPRLRGADANQAIDQQHVFGRYTRTFHELWPGEISVGALRHLRQVTARAVGAAIGSPAGPVHLNLPFGKPLEPVAVPGDLPPGLVEQAHLAVRGREGGAPFVRIARRRPSVDPEVEDRLRGLLDGARRPLLVAGPVSRPDEVGPAARLLSEERGIPLLADPLSGARFGPGRGSWVVGGYDLFLRDEGFRSAATPDLILRVGATPTSASLTRFLEACEGVPQAVVDGGDRWKDHLAVVGEYVPADPARLLARLSERGAGEPAPAGADPVWRRRWVAAEEAVRGALLEGLDDPFHEGTVLAHVVAGATIEETVFVSNSMPVRDLDSFCLPRADGPRILANRGASGIDGIVSSALGAGIGGALRLHDAAGSSGAGRVTAVLGDLALIHDMNGLLALREMAPGSPESRPIFVVINNDGGGIFQMLPIREHEPHFTRFFATPHGLELSRVAALHGLRYLRVEGRGEGGETPDGRGDRGAGSAVPDGEHGLRGVDGLQRALRAARSCDGPVLLEVRTDRDENRRHHAGIMERIRLALERDRGDEASKEDE